MEPNGFQMFQFYLSSIKSDKKVSCMSYNTKFQFYLSSIKSFVPDTEAEYWNLFQFYLSSIKRSFISFL